MPSFDNISLDGGFTFQIEPLPLGGSIDNTATTGLVRYNTGGNNGPFALKGGDFTVEWFSYLTDPTKGGIFWSTFYCEIFSTANPGEGRIRVSYDTSTYFLVTIPDVWNVWDHYAITRSNNVMRLFRNGIQIGNDVTVTTYLQSSSSTFNLFSGSQLGGLGRITNFNWVVGTALYTSNFTPPTSPILPVAGCELLLRASSAPTVTADSSGNDRIPTVASVTYSTETPFSP